MALSAQLQMRQNQSLVMTPQLMQSIRLLQLTHTELLQYVEQEVEKNPLLKQESGSDDGELHAVDSGADSSSSEPGSRRGLVLCGTGSQWQRDLGTAGCRAGRCFPGRQRRTGAGCARTGSPSGSRCRDRPRCQEMAFTILMASPHPPERCATMSVNRSLLPLVIRRSASSPPTSPIISIPCGYLTGDVHETAERLGVAITVVEDVLQILPGL